MQNSPAPPEPTRLGALLFLCKAKAHQFHRILQNLRVPVRRHAQGGLDSALPLLSEWRSELWTDAATPRERALQLGKVQNLRLAARVLSRVEVPAGEVWSFWRQLGRTTRAKGYVEGRELREGCIIAQRGGGLCQLSGAIYNAALEAGLEIVERHAHSNASVGSLARIGRDATVFWNYVDLRLRAPMAWRMEVFLTGTQIGVRIFGAPGLSRGRIAAAPSAPALPVNTCATCGINSCHRATRVDADAPDRTAVLVDTWWPEWQNYLKSLEDRGSTLFLPLDGRRWRRPNLAWDTSLHARVRRHTWLALRRALAARRLRTEGARRQRALLAWDARLAKAYARGLRPEHSHLLVTQTLLPHLWREGVLGGRSFDVLMTRLPLQALHLQLDLAAQRHPHSATCADFRAEPSLVSDETAALSAARNWITPHRYIAELAGEKAVLLPWQNPVIPSCRRAPPGSRRIVYPASTLCRKGSHEVRNAARDLGLEVVLLGGILEGADFWEGVKIVPREACWLDNARAVVLPAYVEHEPRRLLEAAAAGIPVLASQVCGLDGVAGVRSFANPEVLSQVLRACLDSPEEGFLSDERPMLNQNAGAT